MSSAKRSLSSPAGDDGGTTSTGIGKSTFSPDTVPPSPPRRTRVEKGIFVRPNGKTYEIGWRDASGKQRYRKVTGGLRAARAALAEEIARRGRGEKIAADPRLKFSEAAEQWQKQQVTALRPATQDIYKRHLDRHLLPVWGRRRLDDIDVNAAALLIRDMTARGYAAWTIRGVLVVAGRVFDFAIRRLGWRGANPIRQLDHSERPHDDAKPRRVLDGEELARLLDASDGQFALIFRFAAATGCRIGEVLGVVWGDLDFQQGTINFAFQSDRRRQRVALKTKRARRTVELPGWLLSELRAYKLSSPFSGDADLIFCTSNGTPHDHRNVGGGRWPGPSSARGSTRPASPGRRCTPSGAASRRPSSPAAGIWSS